jgi:hypothetical protein
MISDRQLRGLVKKYLARGDCHELDFYRASSNLDEAIDRAGLAETSSGRRHRHQWRIPVSALKKFTAQLQQNRRQLEKADDFDSIYSAVESCKVHGVGALALYDTALRIGAFRDRLPSRVYLHRGALAGAKALRIMRTRGARSVPPSALPLVLIEQLEPYQIEDFLCQFKDDFE